MAAPTYERHLLRMSKLWLREKYIDIKYGIEEWILKKTTPYRLKKSKKIILTSIAYRNAEMTWDDVDVQDEKGRWLTSSSFGVCSKKSWEFDQDMELYDSIVFDKVLQKKAKVVHIAGDQVEVEYLE